jgi:serine/threonine protein kinase/Tol biopolymer transport system component
MTDSRTLQPEDHLAQYRVVGPLGAGGMGEVYLAQDQTLERNVALKVLPPSLVRNEDRVRRFVQEAKSASSLNHPNIVTIYEIGQEPVKSSSGGGDSGPVHFISMELITGKTLGSKIHEEKTDLRTLLGYLAQAAEGIAKAHAAGIVHRDLKPGNIMISDDGFAKVLDFGLAKLTEKGGMAGPNEATEVGSRTVEGAVMGTVHYMSPEQAQGKPVDARSDIFSFGCILYEAATRQRPFTAESNVEILHKIINDRPRPVEEINGKAPAELRRLIRRCLAKSPDQRAQSMKDLAIELREIVDEFESLSASATSASGTTAAVPVGKAKRSMMGPMLIVVSVVAVAAVAFGLWSAKRGSKEPGHQPFQTMRMTTQTSRGDVIGSAMSPDGRYLAYIAGRAGRFTMRVRQVATGSDVEVLPMREGNLEFPCFTPDGNYLFFCARKPDAPLYRVLMSVPSLGGPEQERGFDVDSRVTFSPDGRRVCFVRGVPQSDYTAIIVRNLDTREDRELARIPGPGGPGGGPSWSPDGSLIAMSILTPPPVGGTVIALFDAESGERRDLFARDRMFVNDVAWLRDGRGLAMAGTDIGATLSSQVFMLTYPGAELRRVTNDFNNYGSVTAGAGEEAIAAVRSSTLANVYVVDVDGGAPRALTSTSNAELSPFGIAVGEDLVYFCALRDDFFSLFTVPAAGGQPTPVATGDGHVTAVSTAGGTTVFHRFTADLEGQVWRMNANGGGVSQVNTGRSVELLDLSPDGSLLTFARSDSTRGVWIMPVQGGEAKLVSAKAVSTTGAFSPDGKYVATLELEPGDGGLIRNVFKVYPVEGGDAVASYGFPQNVVSIASCPLDNSISYLDRSDPAWNIFRVSLDGGQPLQVSKFTDGRVTGHVWSDDGKYVAVSRRMADGGNLWVINADGTRPRQLTQFTGMNVNQFMWMPDSRRVVCIAGQTGNDVVLIRNFR